MQEDGRARDVQVDLGLGDTSSDVNEKRSENGVRVHGSKDDSLFRFMNSKSLVHSGPRAKKTEVSPMPHTPSRTYVSKPQLHNRSTVANGKVLAQTRKNDKICENSVDSLHHETTDSLREEIAKTTFKLKYQESKFMESQEHWSNMFNQTFQEKQQLKKEVSVLRERLRCLEVQKTQWISHIAAPDALKTESTTSQDTLEAAYFTHRGYSCEELALAASCKCVSQWGSSACTCLSALIMSNRRIEKLKRDIDQERDRTEESHSVIAAYKRVFAQQLKRNRALTTSFGGLAAEKGPLRKLRKLVKWVIRQMYTVSDEDLVKGQPTDSGSQLARSFSSLSVSTSSSSSSNSNRSSGVSSGGSSDSYTATASASKNVADASTSVLVDEILSRVSSHAEMASITELTEQLDAIAGDSGVLNRQRPFEAFYPQDW